MKEKKVQNVDENELYKIQEEHSQRIFESYKTKSKSFRNYSVILISFGLFFSLAILIPYVSITHRNYNIASKQKDLEPKIAQREKIIIAYDKVQKGIQKLHDDIKAFPDNLRHYISRKLRNEYFGSKIRIKRYDTEGLTPQDVYLPLLCDNFLNEEEKWINCKVSLVVSDVIGGFQETLNSDVASPLQTLDTKSPIEVTKLAEELDSLQTKFEKIYEKNPRFWKTLTGKGKLSIKLDEEVNNFWKKYDSTIKVQSHKLRQELIKLRNIQAQNENELEKLKRKEKDISDRLNHIESPIGRLPLGLNESLLVLPIILAIGFLVWALLFCEIIRLRKAFHNLLQRKDHSRVILTDRQIALIAPLWIDPANHGQNQAIKFLVILILFLIFIMDCSLIYYSWTIPSSFPGTGKTTLWIYGGLYVISLGLFIYGFWQTIAELRRYKEITIT